MRPKAILFDLDATLTDRRASFAKYAGEFHSHFGPQLVGADQASVVETIWHAAEGGGWRGMDTLFADLTSNLPWRSPIDPSALIEHWYNVYPGCAVGRMEMEATLNALAADGYHLGLITNGRIAVQEPKIAAMKLSRWLDPILISEAAGMEKPDQRIFEMALEELGISASEAWFVGDNPHFDMEGARAVGMTGVWMHNQQIWPLDQDSPPHTIETLTDLLALLGMKG
jgi:putative hydrolase of the HAD superfamily